MTTHNETDAAEQWQAKSIAIALRDGLTAVRTGYDGNHAEWFAVTSRSIPGAVRVLTLHRDGPHANQLHCPCKAQEHGLQCGHAGAVLLLLRQELENVAVWTTATAGYQDADC